MLSRRSFIPALMTSLTIPDAMGQCLYPELVLKNGKRVLDNNTSSRWIARAANDSLFSDEPSNEGETIPSQIFNGKMCWKLRCSFCCIRATTMWVDAPEKDEGFD